jgi:anti-sigma B factor antagonist
LSKRVDVAHQTETVMDTLTLHSHTSSPFVIFEAVGELDLHTQDDFEDTVSEQLGRTAVVVDLSGVEFLAASAIRALMVCHGVAGSAGRELYYAGPTRQTTRLLSVAGLDEVLPVRSSVAEAVCASAADPAVLVRSVGGVAHQPLGDLAQLDVG